MRGIRIRGDLTGDPLATVNVRGTLTDLERESESADGELSSVIDPWGGVFGRKELIMSEIQLEIWPLLEEAEHSPEKAQLDQLWVAWDHQPLPPDLEHQLRLGAEVILRIAVILQARSQCLLQGLEDTQVEPDVSEEMLAQFVRQSLVLDLESFLERPETPERLLQEESRVSSVTKEELLGSGLIAEESAGVEDLAYEEDISGWVERIRAYLAEHPGGVRLLDLHQGVGLPLIPVWMSVLLGGLGLQQQGEFYQTETIWIDQIP